MRRLIMVMAFAALSACAQETPAKPPAEPEAALSAEFQAKLAAMDDMELNAAASAADSEFAADLARYSNIAAMNAVCGWNDIDLAPKLEQRFAQSPLSAENKAILRRFYETILAGDTQSWAKDPKAEICTEDNRQSVIRIHRDW